MHPYHKDVLETLFGIPLPDPLVRDIEQVEDAGKTILCGSPLHPHVLLLLAAPYYRGTKRSETSKPDVRDDDVVLQDNGTYYIGTPIVVNDGGKEFDAVLAENWSPTRMDTVHVKFVGRKGPGKRVSSDLVRIMELESIGD